MRIERALCSKTSSYATMSTKRSGLKGFLIGYLFFGCDRLVWIWITLSKRSGLERKREVWLRCVQGWRKKILPEAERGVEIFLSHLLALAHMFCETKGAIDEHLITCLVVLVTGRFRSLPE